MKKKGFFIYILFFSAFKQSMFESQLEDYTSETQRVNICYSIMQM